MVWIQNCWFITNLCYFTAKEAADAAKNAKRW